MTIPYNSDVSQWIRKTRHPNITEKMLYFIAIMRSSNWILALWASVFPCLSCLRQWLPCLLSFVKQTMKLVAGMIPNLQADHTSGWVQPLSYLRSQRFRQFQSWSKRPHSPWEKKAMIHGTLAVYPVSIFSTVFRRVMYLLWLSYCPLSSPVVHGFQGAGNGTCNKTSPENSQDSSKKRLFIQSLNNL